MNEKTSMLEERPGQISTARVVLIATFLCCVLAPVVTVIYGSWGKPEFVKIDPVFLEFCKWAFGLALTGKVGQAIFGEKDPAAVVTPPPAQ